MRPASAPSRLNLRVDGLQFTAGVGDLHVPVDAALGFVDGRGLGGGAFSQGGDVIGEVQHQQRLTQKKRVAEIEAMQERLLNAYLAGTIDEQALAAKQIQLRDEAATLAATMATGETLAPDDVRTALGVFEFAQNAAQIWRGSKMDQKREILESVSLNRLLGDVTLVLEKRKPFDELAKRPLVTPRRGDRI